MPAENAEVIERPADFIWFDGDDTICSVPKENPRDLTKEETQEQLDSWDKTYGHQKFWMISVVNPHVKSTKEQRDWAAEILPKYVKGLACINDSALGRMAINLFIGLRPPSYHLKMFKTAEEAFSWINQIKKDEQ